MVTFFPTAPHAVLAERGPVDFTQLVGEGLLTIALAFGAVFLLVRLWIWWEEVGQCL